MADTNEKVEPKKDYRQQIDELLACYEEGRDIFKNAPVGDWDYPVRLSDKADDYKGELPDSWLGLTEKVLGIIAKEKYDLNVRPNVIEVISDEQMLDAYTSIGMPIMYDHWSFGKDRMRQEKMYQQGMGLAYEIIINSDPAIAYCMESNSKTMMMLVIAHASFGHNYFFNNNHMFKQHTDPKEILNDLVHLKEFISDCEDRYGVVEVEKVIDAVHALKSHGVDRYQKPPKRTPAEIAARRARMEEERLAAVNPVFDKTVPKDTSLKDTFKRAESGYEFRGEENLLKFVASYSPHLPPWQREIINRISDLEQYFYPQGQTQLMNEGCASFWHYTLMHDMHEEGLIDEGMLLEFTDSHCGVVFQPEYNRGFSGRMNPYALGFAIAQDLKRVVENPTDEDKAWFKDTLISGKPLIGHDNWVDVLKYAWNNYKDESYVREFLSPKVMREFGLFAIHDDNDNPVVEVTAIHDDSGYKNVRKVLADSYNLGDNQPRIEVEHYDYKGDRSLVLKHTMFKDKPLEKKNMQEVMKHLYTLWGHPVILESVDQDGEVWDEIEIGRRRSIEAASASSYQRNRAP